MKSVYAAVRGLFARFISPASLATYTSRTTPARFIPRCEPLENRRLLAVVMLKDIDPSGGGSSPYYLTSVGGALFFTADDGTTGEELWTSDGTPAGTKLVRDIQSGPEGSHPEYLTNVDGALFFTADDGVNGPALWKSDGTEAGTVRLKNIGEPGLADVSGYTFTNVGGTLFFSGDDGVTGFELWKSDGTADGTIMVQDIWPGDSSSFPDYLTDVGGTLFFAADDGPRGTELWKSDGTAAGTVRVKDIYAGEYGSYPEFLTDVGGTLYFAAEDASGGKELWKSDATAEGTVLVKDIYPGGDGDYPNSSYPDDLSFIGGTLYFRADSRTGFELWMSDGTEAGTLRVNDIAPEAVTEYPYYLTDVGGTLFVVEGDGAFDELWKTNGTHDGTQRVAELERPTFNDGGREAASVGESLYFVSRIGPPPRPPCPVCPPPAGDNELWISDGTEQGTQVVADIWPGATGSQPAYLTPVGGLLFFSADDGIHGLELWVVTPDEPHVPGDTDGDRDVDIDDLNNVRNDFGCTLPGPCAGDADADGDTDIDDLNAVRNNFGTAAATKPAWPFFAQAAERSSGLSLKRDHLPRPAESVVVEDGDLHPAILQFDVAVTSRPDTVIAAPNAKPLWRANRGHTVDPERHAPLDAVAPQDN